MSYAHDETLEERRPVTGYSRAASGSSSSWGAELLAANNLEADSSPLPVHAFKPGTAPGQSRRRPERVGSGVHSCKRGTSGVA